MDSLGGGGEQKVDPPPPLKNVASDCVVLLVVPISHPLVRLINTGNLNVRFTMKTRFCLLHNLCWPSVSFTASCITAPSTVNDSCQIKKQTKKKRPNPPLIHSASTSLEAHLCFHSEQITKYQKVQKFKATSPHDICTIAGRTSSPELYR